MANKILKTVVMVFAVCAACGSTVGGYYGLKGMIAEQKDKIPLPETLKEFFPDYDSAIQLDDTESPYILSAYEVALSSGTAYYYDLESDAATGFRGSLEFAIGVQDGTVVSYKFIENISEDSMGVGQADDPQLFVGYSLTNTDIETSMTTSHTYASMEIAVRAALEDAQAR